MRNLPWKKIAIGAAAVGIFIVAFFYFNTGSSKKIPTAYVDPAFAEYISSYTAGVLSANSAIRIVLTQNGVDSSAVGAASSAKLFDFSPSISGTVTWLDTRTVEFKPDNRLRSGQVYEVKFYLSKLLQVPSSLKTFEYQFQTIPQ